MQDLGHEAARPGLDNATGDNNCFINAIVQMLFHVDVFRAQFSSMTNRQIQKSPHSHVFCALKATFEKLGTAPSATSAVITSKALREAIAEDCKKDGRFQCQKMDDAVDFLETLLQRIRIDTVSNSDMRSKQHLMPFPFDVFGARISHRGGCSCGSDGVPSNTFDCFMNASVALIQEASTDSATPFGAKLKHAIFDGLSLSCSKTGCDKNVPAMTSLQRAPPVVLIRLHWSTATASATLIRALLGNMGEQLVLRDMFSNLDRPYPYTLVGVVCYYGQHYATFVCDVRTQTWTMFDDALVKVVGSWLDVVARCQSARWQPQLLVYSRLGDEYQPPPMYQPPPTANQPAEHRGRHHNGDLTARDAVALLHRQYCNQATLNGGVDYDVSNFNAGVYDLPREQNLPVPPPCPARRSQPNIVPAASGAQVSRHPSGDGHPMYEVPVSGGTSVNQPCIAPPTKDDSRHVYDVIDIPDAEQPSTAPLYDPLHGPSVGAGSGGDARAMQQPAAYDNPCAGVAFNFQGRHGAINVYDNATTEGAPPYPALAHNDYGLLSGHAPTAAAPATKQPHLDAATSSAASDDDASTCISFGTIAVPEMHRYRGITPSEHGSVCSNDLDRVCYFVDAASNHQHKRRYSKARDCYQKAANAMMDFVEMWSDEWPDRTREQSKEKAILMAKRYLEFAERMDRKHYARERKEGRMAPMPRDPHR
eukprot:m.899018 g.899018  ORF g.899018 m.899018 type:complete len:705 (-) comp23677_c0_seq2:167-2281(-)